MSEWSQEDRELPELTFVAGSYACPAVVLNSAGLEPPAGSDKSY